MFPRRHPTVIQFAKIRNNCKTSYFSPVKCTDPVSLMIFCMFVERCTQPWRTTPGQHPSPLPSLHPNHRVAPPYYGSSSIWSDNTFTRLNSHLLLSCKVGNDLNPRMFTSGKPLPKRVWQYFGLEYCCTPARVLLYARPEYWCMHGRSTGVCTGGVLVYARPEYCCIPKTPLFQRKNNTGHRNWRCIIRNPSIEWLTSIHPSASCPKGKPSPPRMCRRRPMLNGAGDIVDSDLWAYHHSQCRMNRIAAQFCTRMSRHVYQMLSAAML